MGRPSLALTFSSAAYIATGYLVSVGLARLLAPAGFGTYSVVAAILTVVNFIVGRGVPVAASRAIAAAPITLTPVMRAAWRATTWLVVATLALTLLAAWPAGTLLGADVRTPLLVGAIAAITFAAQAMSVAPLNGLRQFAWQAWTRIGYSLARVVLILLGAWQWGVTGAIAGYVAAPLIASIPAFFAPVRRTQTTDGETDSAASRATSSHATTAATTAAARQLLRQAVPLLLTSVWVSLLLTVDLITVRAVASAHDTGLYGAAGTLAHVPFFLMAMLPTETLPRLAAEQEPTARRRLASRILDDSVLMLAAPSLLIIALGPWVMELIFGAEFASGEVLLAPLVVATAAVTVHSMLVAVDGAASRLRRTVLLGALGTAAMAALVAAVGSGGDIADAAWAAAAVAVLLMVVHWRMTAREQRIGMPNMTSFALLGALGFVAALAATGTDDLIVGVIGTVAGLLATWIAAPRLLRRG